MLKNTEIKIKNYKCFGPELQGFNRILPINVIIGKNNSGKSSLVDVVANLIPVNEKWFKRPNLKPQELVISDLITEDAVRIVFAQNLRGGPVPEKYASHFEYGRTLVGTQIRYSYTGNRKMLISFSPEPQFARQLAAKVLDHIPFPFEGKSFKRVCSERDIDLEREEFPPYLKAKGAGATNVIQQFINSTELDAAVVEERLLAELNEIVNPELVFKRILVQKNGQGLWEIYFENQFRQLIPLSSMGSGIKTILLVLINLHLIPVLEKTPASNYIFAFEELENNLHPSIQRKLFTYLRNYSKENQCIFFLTTHSNVAIDLFAKDDESQVLHVVNNGQSSSVSDVINYSHSKQVLEDLDIRASDLLQSNGIIWVEGPSDRIYLKRWLLVAAPDLIEGVHYTVMFYGGRLLSRVHFLPDFLDQELIPLLRVNRNAYVIIDRDAKTVSDELNETKARVLNELGENSCWITAGREIENYVPNSVLAQWLQKRHGIKCKLSGKKFSKMESVIQNSGKIKYAADKVRYANEIIEFIGPDHLNQFDLSSKVTELANVIRKWNRLLT